jgi:hypothetical protein
MTAVTKTLGSALLALSLASVAQAGPARQCADESEKLVGQRAALVGKDFRAPRKLRDVPLEFPTRPGATKAGSSIWLGDALVDQEGKVREVWTLRPLRFDPPWPEFESAIAASIRQWVYEPSVVDGKPSPVCVTVSVSINWK